MYICTGLNFNFITVQIKRKLYDNFNFIKISALITTLNISLAI